MILSPVLYSKLQWGRLCFHCRVNSHAYGPDYLLTLRAKIQFGKIYGWLAVIIKVESGSTSTVTKSRPHIFSYCISTRKATKGHVQIHVKFTWKWKSTFEISKMAMLESSLWKHWGYGSVKYRHFTEISIKMGNMCLHHPYRCLLNSQIFRTIFWKSSSIYSFLWSQQSFFTCSKFVIIITK